jgi:hypothetical protein
LVSKLDRMIERASASDFTRPIVMAWTITLPLPSLRRAGSEGATAGVGGHLVQQFTLRAAADDVDDGDKMIGRRGRSPLRLHIDQEAPHATVLRWRGYAVKMFSTAKL